MGDTIRVVCSSCGKGIKAPDEYAGRTVNCPGCKSPIRIPPSLPPLMPEANPVPPSTPSGASSVGQGETGAVLEIADAAFGKIRESVIADTSRYEMSKGRYPELVWYLKALRLLSKVYMVIAVAFPAYILINNLYVDVLT